MIFNRFIPDVRLFRDPVDPDCLKIPGINDQTEYFSKDSWSGPEDRLINGNIFPIAFRSYN